MGKPKLACENCGLDYQSEAAVNRHIRQKHNGRARVITYNKLLADMRDGMYADRLVGQSTKVTLSEVDVARIMHEELTVEAARSIAKKILFDTLTYPQLLAPGLRALIADYIATLKYLFGDESNLNLPSSRINNEALQENLSISTTEFFKYYAYLHPPKHKTSMGKPGKTKRTIEDLSVPDPSSRIKNQNVVQENLSNYSHAPKYKISARQPDSVNRLIEDLRLDIKRDQTVYSHSLREDENDSHT